MDHFELEGDTIIIIWGCMQAFTSLLPASVIRPLNKLMFKFQLSDSPNIWCTRLNTQHKQAMPLAFLKKMFASRLIIYQYEKLIGYTTENSIYSNMELLTNPELIDPKVIITHERAELFILVMLEVFC
jgi:hypothetical protein